MCIYTPLTANFFLTFASVFFLVGVDFEFRKNIPRYCDEYTHTQHNVRLYVNEFEFFEPSFFLNAFCTVANTISRSHLHTHTHSNRTIHTLGHTKNVFDTALQQPQQSDRFFFLLRVSLSLSFSRLLFVSLPLSSLSSPSSV